MFRSRLTVCTFFIYTVLAAKLISCDGDDTLGFKHSSGQCTSNSGGQCNIPEDDSIKSRYSEKNNKWASYLQNIEYAVSEYTPCQAKNCSCYTDLIADDLKTFSDGISSSQIEKARERGTLYQIIGGKLYRDKECMFPSRCSGIEHFILKVIKDLPDTEFVVNTRDWPQVSKHFGNPLPIFSFSKTGDYLDITYPAWTFWEGGPAISLYPRGLGRWDLHRKSLKKAAEQYPWEDKLPKGFFRGSRTSSERDPLVLLSREKPQLVDAQYTKNQAWKSKSDTLGADPAPEVSLEDHCRYKYLFNYRGVAASFRFKHLFLCDSLVFHVGNDWIEFFYPPMKPWVHYIPVESSATKRELEQLIEFAIENDETLRQIAVRGRDFIQDHLKMKDVECYWKKLLLDYSKLLKYKPELNRSLKQIY